MDARSLSAVADLGYALIRAGALADARRLWEGLAAEAGHLEAPWRALAMIALRDGRIEDAVSAATIANQRQPSSPAPLVLRAEALLRTGRYQDAARDLDAALSMAPRRREDLLVLARARALRRQGRL